MRQAQRRMCQNPLAVAVWAGLALLALSPAPAFAIPSFARQTGLQCATCHTVFPELTAFGREFKLRGYTLGSVLEAKRFPYNLPLSVGLQVGNTSVNDPNKGADAAADFPRAGTTILQQVALYYGGRVAGKLGAIAQYNWDGLDQKWGAEMIDIRYANSATTTMGQEIVYGASLTNSPTEGDLWATTPMWAFPHLQDAGIMPMQTSLFDMTLDNQIGDFTLYGFYGGRYYAALGLLHNGQSGVLHLLNGDDELTTAIDGNAPHLRLAWERDHGAYNLMLGLHALQAKIFPNPGLQSGPADRFTDFALDGQYQYTGEDSLFSVQAFLDREKRDWEASYPMMASNPSDILDTFKANVHYWYKRKIGGGLGVFDYWGDSDILKYGMGGMPSAMDNATGSPDTRGWIIEADWLPLENEQNLKFGLRHTTYIKFNGASDNYNGFGRNASDNDAWFAYLWLLY